MNLFSNRFSLILTIVGINNFFSFLKHMLQCGSALAITGTSFPPYAESCCLKQVLSIFFSSFFFFGSTNVS